MATGNSASIDSLELDIQYKATKAASQINKLAKALTNLKEAASGAELGQVSEALKNAGSSSDKATSSFGKFKKALTLGGALYSMKRAYNMVKEWVNLSMDYIENVNLFTVSMGKFADEAKEYAEAVSEAMGIDPSEWMRNQGVFMTLATGFGIVSDRAYIMSKNLTQLGYDISSFFNIDYAEAMQKLQSGIAGEIEPLRRLGYDISQAKLEATALSLGIDKLVKDMTQAEKAELRYYAIMSQVTTVQGDMARTLEQPANQMRILKAQITQTARAIGNVFIPILNAVIPYIIAFFRVLRDAADMLADLVGFEMPEVDYEDNTFGEISSDMDDATESAKKLNKQLASFDEINNITISDSIETNNGIGSGFDFELPEYDFIGDAIEGKVDVVYGQMKDIAEFALVFISAFTGIKLLQGIDDIAKSLSGLATNAINSKLLPALVGGFGLAWGFNQVKSAARNFASYMSGNGPLGSSLYELVGGVAITSVSGAIIGGSLGGLAVGGPVGAVIGGILGIGTAIATIINDTKKHKMENLLSQFFRDTGTDVGYLFEKISELYEPYKEYLADQENLNKEVKTAAEKVNTYRDSVDQMLESLSQREEISSKDVEDLAQAIDDLYQASITLDVAETKSVMSSFGQAIKLGIEPGRQAIEDMLNQYTLAKELLGDAKWQDNARAKEILESAKQRGYFTEAESAEIKEITTRLGAGNIQRQVTGNIEVQRLIDNAAVNGLKGDWESVEADLKEAKNAISDFRDELIYYADKQIAIYKADYADLEAYGLSKGVATPEEYSQIIYNSVNEMLNDVAKEYSPALEIIRDAIGEYRWDYSVNRDIGFFEDIWYFLEGMATFTPHQDVIDNAVAKEIWGQVGGIITAQTELENLLSTDLVSSVAEGVSTALGNQGDVSINATVDEGVLFSAIVNKNAEVVSATGESPLITNRLTRYAQ